MKVVRKIGIILLALAILTIIFVGTAKWAIFSDYGYYEKLYEKYQVSDDMDMDMEHIMAVTYEMMDFLDGKRSNLNISTIVDGQQTEFFSSDEQTHMQDVKDIFDMFIFAGNISFIYIVIFVIISIILCFMKKLDYRQLIIEVAKCIVIVFSLILCVVIAIVVYAMVDFTSAFTLMHKIMFDNDLWLMDPDTSLLINMLPEGFFADMAVRIISCVGIVFLVVWTLCIIIWILDTHKRSKVLKNTKCANC